jgi:hypothetical protein
VAAGVEAHPKADLAGLQAHLDATAVPQRVGAENSDQAHFVADGVKGTTESHPDAGEVTIPRGRNLFGRSTLFKGVDGSPNVAGRD